jgi:hypothetical protein
MSATAGGAGFTLTVNGSNFSSGATLGWLNPDNPGTFGRAATYVSTTQLTVQISAADIAIPSPSVQVSVVPAVGVTPSNKVTFAINPGPPGVLKTITTGASGASPNGSSADPALSFNGRFVAFSSQATNLIAPSANFPERYVRDTCLGTDPVTATCTPSTLLVSAITGGSPSNPMEGNGQGGATPSIGNQNFTPVASGIPPYGRFIGFLSTARNLAATNTTFQQAFMRDTCVGAAAPTGCTPSTVLASVTQSGTEPNGPASEFAFASNTCAAAFASAGTDVLNGVATPANEIYLASCVSTGAPGSFTTSALASASSSGVAGDQGGQQPAISADGLFVAFASKSTNLTTTSNGGFQQIYLRDACSLAPMGCPASTTIVSVDSSGGALAGDSSLPAISNDGRFVVFTTQVPQTIGVKGVVSLRDTCLSITAPTGCIPSTTIVSVAAAGGPADGPSNSSRHAVSGDGRFVVFDSSATNLVTPATSGNQVFVRDTCKSSSGTVSNCTPNTVLISVDNTGKVTGGFLAAISDDGHFAAFVTTIGAVQQILLAATGF